MTTNKPYRKHCWRERYEIVQAKKNVFIDYFHWFKKTYPEKKFTKKQLYYVYKTFLKRIMEAILEGYIFNMGQHLCSIGAYICERWQKNLFDYPNSMKEKRRLIAEGKIPKSRENPEGEDWMVLYTDPTYPAIRWKKKGCMVKNRSVYRFRTINSNHERLVHLIQDNPSASILFAHVDRNYKVKRKVA